VSAVGSYVGCDCAEVFAARMQAIADQIMGVVALSEAKMIEPYEPQLILHYTKAQELMQRAIDTYAEQHGQPNADRAVGAAEWLLQGLKH
jgi:hypothetical protein